MLAQVKFVRSSKLTLHQIVSQGCLQPGSRKLLEMASMGRGIDPHGPILYCLVHRRKGYRAQTAHVHSLGLSKLLYRICMIPFAWRQFFCYRPEKKLSVQRPLDCSEIN